MTDEKIRWHIPQRVILFKPEEDATLEIMQQDNEILGQMLETGTPPIHTIIDLSNIGIIPGSLQDIEQSLAFLSHDDGSWITVYGAIDVILSVGTIWAKQYGRNLKFVANLKEAVSLLHEVDPTIPAE